MTKPSDWVGDLPTHGSPITVLCAPPGFRKKQILAGLWQDERQKGRALFFDHIDHHENAKAASHAVLQQDGASVVFITDVAHCDTDFLSLALDRMVRMQANGADKRVFIAMDDPSTLDVARARTMGHVAWIGPDALSLGDQELREQFATIGLVENRKRLSAIAGRWPIAADMLADWAQRSSEPIGGLSDQDILHETGLYEFIEAHVWSKLGDRDRDALSRAALLSYPKRSLLKSERGFDRILAKLTVQLAGLIEQSGDLITFNPAFQLFVCEHGQLNDPEAQIEMMIDLTERCSSQGSLSDAARLAASAGKPDRIASIAEQHGALLIWVLCGFSDLQSLVENAGRNVVSQSPVLRMMQCIVDLKLGRINEAEAELQRLAADSSIAQTMKAEVEIIRVTLLVYGCSLARQHDIKLLADLLAQQSSQPAWQSFLATLSCILNSQRARFDTASASLLEARREAERAGSRYNIMFLYLHEAGLHIAKGAVPKARSAIASARKMWREEFAADVGVETVIAALSSKVELETGHLTSARNALRKSANRLPDGEAWFDIYFVAYEPMARVLVREQGLARTLEVLEAERGKLEARGLGRVARLLDGIGYCLVGEARLRTDAQVEAISVPCLQPDEMWSWQERETYTLADAYRLDGEGRRSDAVALLAEAKQSAKENELVHSEFRYALALFLLLHRAERSDEALRCLNEIVVLSHMTGMRLVAQDVIGPLVKEYSANLSEPGALDESQRKTLAELGRQRIDQASPKAGLSRREMDVITALAEGGSDKEIARNLGVTDHGVRYHLKNIFRKLGVHDRLTAVIAAKQRGWI